MRESTVELAPLIQRGGLHLRYSSPVYKIRLLSAIAALSPFNEHIQKTVDECCENAEKVEDQAYIILQLMLVASIVAVKRSLHTLESNDGRNIVVVQEIIRVDEL